MNKCNHEWINITTKDDDKKTLMCSKCGKKIHKGQLSARITVDTSAPISLAAGREKKKMPFYDGEKTTIVEVYKDELVKELYKGLNVSNLNSIKR